MAATQPLQDMLNRLHDRLAAVEAKLGVAPRSPRAASAVAPAPVPVQVAPRIEAYDEFTQTYLTPFLTAAAKLGPEVEKYGEIVKRAFVAQRMYLVAASVSKKPAGPVMVLLAPIQECMKEINKLRDNRSEFAHHQNMLNEGIQSLGWLCVEPAPKPFIESYIGGGDFWGNKIRVQYKTSNPDQIEFVASFKTLLVQLMAYVKEHHTTGVTWNAQGGDVANFSSVASAPAAPVAEAAPKPAAPAAVGGMNAIFAGIKSIDQSGGKTSGLRTVTKDQQTWRKEYKGSDAPTPAPVKAVAPKPVHAAAPAPAQDPICEIRNGNWFVAHQKDIFTLSDVNLKQQVYIFNCNQATLIIEGKAKTIALDKCTKTKLIFDSAVSSIEIVNCKNVQVQSKGKVPAVAIDKTDGCLVYLSYEGRDVQFVTSKSSEMNVAFPQAEGSEEYIERPIPEQFVHRITDNDTISSDVSDLYSH
ncbi:adenylyl cyclase-associated protein [Thraustotheca clavata]|uniref:Adenylyl cyclase-associated protein n=1 Tax=Thraustotheca clavata TaxID=74557 RepID=A0A1V9ZPW7_9STRA|nr:adenylyl cyclase-associated protein [Thraustotheca clavata]